MIVETQNTTYVLEDAGDGAFYIYGHSLYCPAPVRVILLHEPTLNARMAWQYCGRRPFDGCKSYVVTSPVKRIEP